MNPYLEEVIDLHVAIEALFARGEGQIESMVARFHPAFSMITPTGLQVDLQAVEQLFTQRSGTQPGLTIELTDLVILAQGPDGAMVCYRETHRLPAQAAKTRISTALFSFQEGRVLWRHLHETWAA
ncbi:hypothetical protein G7Z99_18470 [Pseudomonas entomophila]|uniref:DUF4440 domain-containing protein n=1 Tax=Pseudomonas entomophila TaxID=312306 RepID=UPI0015E38083|nr:DUF4440 domain-containing protein [Pseudomonas entomophila]MBA1191010.1 hypothetical protein [Pseudomonas entomophila]